MERRIVSTRLLSSEVTSISYLASTAYASCERKAKDKNTPDQDTIALEGGEVVQRAAADLDRSEHEVDINLLRFHRFQRSHGDTHVLQVLDGVRQASVDVLFEHVDVLHLRPVDGVESASVQHLPSFNLKPRERASATLRTQEIMLPCSDATDKCKYMYTVNQKLKRNTPVTSCIAPTLMASGISLTSSLNSWNLAISARQSDRMGSLSTNSYSTPTQITLHAYYKNSRFFQFLSKNSMRDASFTHSAHLLAVLLPQEVVVRVLCERAVDLGSEGAHRGAEHHGQFRDFLVLGYRLVQVF